jgi:hypothetical protein
MRSRTVEGRGEAGKTWTRHGHTNENNWNNNEQMNEPNGVRSSIIHRRQEDEEENRETMSIALVSVRQ